MRIRYFLFIIVGLLSIGAWSGCRSATTPDRPPEGEELMRKASASADIVIVEVEAGATSLIPS